MRFITPKYNCCSISIICLYVLFAGCSGNHGPDIVDPFKGWYYSLEEALDHKEDARVLALKDIGDSLSSDIGLLKKLNELNIKDSDIRFLPDELANLPYLFSVYINHCKFNHIPAQLCRSLTCKSVGMTDMMIEVIPPEFKRVEQLQSLNLAGNLLTKFESENVDLRALRFLNLSNNKLIDLALDTLVTPNLKFLYVTGNNLADTTLGRLRAKLPNTIIVN